MLIHTEFEVHHFQNCDCEAAVWFETADGERLIDRNNKYVLAGTPASRVDFSPSYEFTRYEDFTLFMPLEELHLGVGERALRLRVLIRDRLISEPLAYSDYYYFTAFARMPPSLLGGGMASGGLGAAAPRW